MRRSGYAFIVIAAVLFLTACATAHSRIRIAATGGLIYQVTAHGGIDVTPIPQPGGRGTMILDGGDALHGIVGETFVADAGPKPVLCLIDTASRGRGTPYRQFDRFDGLRMLIFNITAETSADPEAIRALERCTGYYFSGGRVQLLSEGFLKGRGDSPALAVIRDRYEFHGAVIAGTSAGAMTQGPITLCHSESGPDSNAQTSDLPCLNPGFRFVDDVLIDVHFFVRGLIGRNLNAMAKIDEPVSVGIDQQAAVVVPGDGGLWQVAGEGSVALIQRDPSAAAGATRKFTISVLNTGDRFDPYTGRVAIAMTRQPQRMTSEPDAGPLRMTDIFGRDRVLQLIERFAHGPNATAEGLGEAEGLVVALRKPANAAVFADAHSTSVLNLEISISRF
jgi:cyanophycinase